MRLTSNAWTFEGALSAEMCDQIIKYGKQQVSEQATVAGGAVIKIRSSEVAWLYDPWILDMLYPYVTRANKKAGWNFQWEPVQQIQFTIYKKGQYYDWHRDTKIAHFKSGKIRKLSVTVNLNDDYEGGEMYVDSEENYMKPAPQKLEMLQKAGSITVFPSDIWHKVDPVTKGVRHSLVVWLLGDPWK